MAASRSFDPHDPAPAKTFLTLIRQQLEGIRADVPHLVDMGQAIGDALLAGGTMFIGRVAPFLGSEMGGRAGGMMNLRGKPENAEDVGLFAMPDPRRWDAANDEALARLVGGKAKLFAVGRREDLPDAAARRVEAFTGGTDPTVGLYAYGDYAPLASTRQFEQFVRAWITFGEAVAACTRGEQMPVLYMSVWLEGGIARNAAFSFTDYNNFGEPRDCRPLVPTPVFHHERYVPPLAAGYPAEQFLATTQRFIDVLDRQLDAMAEAGRWIADALQADKRVHVTAVGHSYPRILELPEAETGDRWHRRTPSYDKSIYPFEWAVSRSDLLKALPDDLGDGDVMLHLGYAPVLKERVDTILARGVKLIHTSPYGRRMDTPEHPNFLWFDLPWRPGDADVDIPGYGARMMPASSTSHSIAYNAILAETAERMGWR